MSDAKVVDKRTQSEAGEYGLSFASRKNTGVIDPGHAFIVWFYSDPVGLKTARRVTGFYPVGVTYKVVAGIAPGDVLDDSDTDIEKQLVVKVSKPVFESALAVEAEYADGTYTLGFNDCVTFVESVAQKVPNLQLPERAISPFPSTYIAALWDLN